MIKSYKDLIVWQKSMDVVEEIYSLTEKLPQKEQYGLVSQMRRSAISIPSNIAEGYGRNTTGNNVQFLSVSKGSLLELETQLELCKRLKYLNENEHTQTEEKLIEVNKMITVLISKLKEKMKDRG